MSDGRDASPHAAHPTETVRTPAGRAELLALALLTVLALALRLWRLDALPGGPHVDEAWNWIDARRVLDGWRPIFLPENAGREILYTYFQAALLGIFGDSLAVARAASAIAATAMVPLAWAVSRALAPRGIRRAWVGLPCAALAAGSYWSLHFGRFGIRAITFPLFVGGVALLWLRATEAERRRGAERAAKHDMDPAPDLAASDPGPPWKRLRMALSRHRWALACGLVLGLAVYSHPAGRGLVVLPLAHTAWLVWRGWIERRGGRRGARNARNQEESTGEGAPATGKTEPTSTWWRPALGPLRALGLTALVALIVAAPVIGWWIAHPGFFLGHAGEVSVVGAGPGAVLANVGKALGMFNLAGDPARWRNLPGRPVFDALTGLLFLGGLALALRATLRGEPGPALALAWLGVLLAPTVLADQAPNFSRAIGILPVVYVFPALTLGWLAGRILNMGGNGHRESGRDRPSWAHMAALALVAVVPLRAGEATVRDYFVEWAQHPETPIAFDDDLAHLGRLAGEIWSQGGAAYLSPEMAAHPTIRVSSPELVPGVDTTRGIAVRERASEGSSTASASGDPSGDGSAAIASGRYLYASRVGTEVSHHGGSYGWGNVPTSTGDAVTVLQQDLPERGISGRLALLDPRNLIVPLRPIRFGPLELVHAAIGPLGMLQGMGTVITLGWRAAGPTEAALTQTVRLVDDEGRTLAQHDGLPLGPGHPTHRWREGEIVLVRSELEIREDRLPWRGDATVLVGWYTLSLPEREGEPPRTEDLLSAEGESLAEVGPALYVDFDGGTSP